MKKQFSILPIVLMILFIGCEKEELSEADLSSLEVIDQTVVDLNNGSNGSAKIDICHNGNLINVSVNSLKAHGAHGDAFDMDGDGYFDKECACGEEVDTDDSDPNINPGTEDPCGDAVDLDGDGYYDRPGACGEEVDCHDSDPAIHPGAEEICGDGIDQNCDGLDEECTCPCFSKEDLALVAWEPWACSGWGPCILTTNDILEDGSCGGDVGVRGLAAAGCGFAGLPGPNEAWLIDYTDGEPNWTPLTKPDCGGLQEGEVLACQQLICEQYEALTGTSACSGSADNNNNGRISASETDNAIWKTVTR